MPVVSLFPAIPEPLTFAVGDEVRALRYPHRTFRQQPCRVSGRVVVARAESLDVVGPTGFHTVLSAEAERLS